MAEQELDLFQISARFAAELRTGAAQVVSAETLDADLLRRLLHYRPDRPVAQTWREPLCRPSILTGRAYLQQARPRSAKR